MKEFPGLENWYEASGEAEGVGFDRRRFLQLMAASMGLAGLTSCRRPSHEIVPFARRPEETVPGLPTYYATTIPRPGSCFPVIVESHEGRPTKIEGNPLHPASRGATDVWAQASILDLYDPNRAKTVLRDGQPSSWEEFDKWAAENFDRYLNNTTQKMAIEVEPIPSPAMRMLRKHVKSIAPHVIWSEYSVLDGGDEFSIFYNTAGLGTLQAFGSHFNLTYRFDLARTILVLDADPLGVDPEMVRHTRDFAAGRRATSMNRLYVVENAVTVTGMNADHRLPLRSSDIGRYALTLLRVLRREQLPADPGFSSNWLDAVADDLRANPGKGIVMAGPRQPQWVHQIVHHINEVLTNNGAAVEFRPTIRSPYEDRRLASGPHIRFGYHPVSEDEEFGQLSHVCLIGGSVKWRLPLAHYLESWGDAETADGTYSPVQPLIAPLHGGRSPLEILARLLKYDLTDGYEIVKRSFARRSRRRDEASFRRWLHEGVLKESARAPVKPRINPATTKELLPYADVTGVQSRLKFVQIEPKLPSADELESTYYFENHLLDGRFAGNGWLHELPDPVTKLTWESVILLSPRTADQLQLKSGDVVRVTNRHPIRELPVLVQPGHADGSVSVPVGGLRWLGSFTEKNIGIERTGRRVELAITQEHGRMEGRDLARVQNHGEHPKHEHNAHGRIRLDLATPPEFDAPHQWGMVIDLTACTGCSACVVACQAENNIPIVGRDEVLRGREMQWIRVDRYMLDDGGFVAQPVMCQHCESAPCEPVCPVNASVHSPEGLNLQVYNRCIGTRYCSNNCPYKARRFNWFDYHQRPLDALRLGPLAEKGMPETLKMQKNPDVTVRMRGVMEKCTYCVQRIERGKIGAKLASEPVADGAIVPACAQACPASAIVFGNLADPNSRVAKLKKSEDDYALLGELNTKPRTTYRAKLRNPNPRMT